MASKAINTSNPNSDEQHQYEHLFDYKSIKKLTYVSNIEQYYESGVIIGKGSQGKVKEVTNIKLNCTFAMKII